MGHDPIRTCCGCRTRRKKAELLRFRAGLQNRLEPDPEKTLAGRGAYLCPRVECLDRALKKKAFFRTLRKKDLIIGVDGMRRIVLKEQARRTGKKGNAG